jgi:hypothetical protein
VEWPLPLGEEGEKQGVGDPGKRNNSKITTRTIKRERQGKQRQQKVTAGRG